MVELIGRINKCGVISPRFDLALGKIEQWCNNLLPSRQFGYIVMTTSLGIMDHEEVQPGPNLSRCLSFPEYRLISASIYPLFPMYY